MRKPEGYRQEDGHTRESSRLGARADSQHEAKECVSAHLQSRQRPPEGGLTSQREAAVPWVTTTLGGGARPSASLHGDAGRVKKPSSMYLLQTCAKQRWLAIAVLNMRLQKPDSARTAHSTP